MLWSLNLQSFDPDKTIPQHPGDGLFGLATRDGDGNWINAVGMNVVGTQKIIMGPWKPSYCLGTYVIDPSSKSDWAVVDYESDFAVAPYPIKHYPTWTAILPTQISNPTGKGE